MKKNIISALIILSVLGTSCKKYPEGPSFSLRNKKSRLAGNWKINKYNENGADSLAVLSNIDINIGRNYGFSAPEATKDKYTEIKDVNSNSLIGYVGFIAEGDYLSFYPTDPTNPDQSLMFKIRYVLSVVNSDTTQAYVYKILKLTKKEVKLSSLDYAVQKKEIILNR